MHARADNLILLPINFYFPEYYLGGSRFRTTSLTAKMKMKMNMRLNIKFDSVILGMQRYGGISNYWSRLIAGVSSLYPESKNIMPVNSFDHDLGENVIHERMPVTISRYLPVHNVKRNDIFHTSYYRWPMFKCKAYVVTVYDFTYERFSRSLQKYSHSLQKFESIRRADALICISESTKKDLLYYCDDIDPKKVHVVHLGIEPSEFYCTKDVSDYRRHNNEVLFVGRRGGYKRFDLALEAVSKMKTLTLTVVGEKVTASEQKILDDRLYGRWKALENVNSSQLRELYEASFAFMFPSDYEGFGLPLIESMACGCPVISSSLSSLPEVGAGAVLYARNQDFESYYNQLLALTESEELRVNMIKLGLLRVKEFTWRKMVLETVEIYNLLK